MVRLRCVLGVQKHCVGIKSCNKIRRKEYMKGRNYFICILRMCLDKCTLTDVTILTDVTVTRLICWN